MTRSGRLAAGVIVMLTLSSCGASGFSRAEAVASFKAANPDASTTQAACVIDALIEEYEGEPVDEEALDGLEAELLALPQGERFLLDQFRAKFGCGMTEGVEAQLRRELLDNDIDEAAVDCVAEVLASRLTDADLEVLIGDTDLIDEDNDSFYANFFRAVETCDALPS